MATAKKTATKENSASSAAKQKTVEKKTAAAKPEAKNTAVKKPDDKKAAAKKTDAKAVETKKSAAKTTSVKKDQAKTAETKKAESKTTAAEANKTSESNIKYRNLFDAFIQGKLPTAHGYIVSSFFNERNAYSIYEIVSYAGVKDIYPSGMDLTFIAGGKKLHILVEHDTYQSRHVEPIYREKGESIPKRESELEIVTARNQTRIMVAREPVEITGSFTILKPYNLNFAYVFYHLPDIYQSLAAFFEWSLNKQRKVPQADAKKAALLIASTIQKTMDFKSEYE